MIKLLTIECKGVACISAFNNAQNEPSTKVSLEDVPKYELIQAVIKLASVNEILDNIDDKDIYAYFEVKNNEH